MKKTSKSVDISLNGELSWPYLEMAKKKKKKLVPNHRGCIHSISFMSLGRKKTKRKSFSRQQLTGSLSDSGPYPSSIHPDPQEQTLTHPCVAPMVLTFSSHLSLYIFLSHFLVFNSHKILFEHILDEGNITGSAEYLEWLNPTHCLAARGWGLNKDLSSINHE